MADATKSQLLTRLNIKVRDGGDITFTPQEKNDALTTAINDPYVVSIVRDANTTTVANTDHYTIPSTITTLLKLGIQLNPYGRPTDMENWDVYGGVVYLPSLPLSGKTLVMIGSYKLTQFDAIPDDRQEYVLVLAKLDLLNMLKGSLATTFLTNDMTMADLLNLENSLQREAENWRSKFANQVVEL